MREPERSEGQWRGKTFCLLLRRLSKVSRRKGGARRAPWRIKWICPQIQKIKRSQPACIVSDYEGLAVNPVLSLPYAAIFSNIKRSQPTQEAYYFLATITARMGAGKPSMVLLWSFGSR